MKAVIYARYSSDNQREESISEGAEGIILESVLEGYEHSNGHNKKSNMD